mmetsp:Transcript_18957/g.59553  ORF Transcript_18957/g.59553 Transcript_18957/m.59553 type:complete len:250 (+) Transcript_18957:138-887(+)
MMATGGFGNEIEAYGGGFFDRLSNSVSGMPRDTYDYAELQDCRTHLRLCAARIQELESINVDLEARLEAQANEYVRLETDAAESQARWKAQYEALENECEMWRQSNAQLELKNHKLRDQLLRTERELHGILQKKYDFMELARQEERDRIRAEQALAADHARDPARHLPPTAPLRAALHRTYGDPNPNNRHNHATHPGRRPPAVDGHARNQNPHGLTPADVRRNRSICALADFFGFTTHRRGDDDDDNNL